MSAYEGLSEKWDECNMNPYVYLTNWLKVIGMEGHVICRPPQVDCAHEPTYPGLHNYRMTLADPSLLTHLPDSFCRIEEPHPVEVCLSWLSPL